jgi:hypothetical protein
MPILQARNLMLVLLVLVSLSATSSATADELQAESYPTALVGSGSNEINTTYLNWNCPGTTYDATLAGASTTLVITPTFQDCAPLFLTQVHRNGCVYIAHIEGGASTQGSIDLSCPPGNSLQITFKSGGSTRCIIDIPEQSNIAGSVKFSNASAGTTREIVLGLSLNGVRYTETPGSGQLPCSSGESKNGSLTASISFTGNTDVATPPGYYLSATNAKLKSYTHPGFTDTLTTTAGTFSCKKPQYSASLNGYASTVTLTPTFSECTLGGFPAIVDTNGCDFKLEVSEVSPSQGTLGLSCPVGSGLTITSVVAATSKCTLHIPAQPNMSRAVPLSLIGEGSTTEVTTVANFSNVEYTHTGGSGLGACSSGSATTGTFATKTVLTAESVSTGAHTALGLGPIPPPKPVHTGVFVRE